MLFDRPGWQVKLDPLHVGLFLEVDTYMFLEIDTYMYNECMG
jgi:hypothetical protein